MRTLGIALGVLFGAALSWPCAAMDWNYIPPENRYCNTIEVLEAKLAVRHHERLIIKGAERARGQYRLYYSNRTGSWTMVWVDLDGAACVRLIGKHRPEFFGDRI